jgi:hypothetical protein
VDNSLTKKAILKEQFYKQLGTVFKSVLTNSIVNNSRFAKAGVSCFYDSEVLNSSFVHLMKFSAKNPRLRKAAKRYNKRRTK